MSMKNKVLLTFLFVLLSTSAYSSVPDDGDNFYVFTNGNNSRVVYSLDNIDKIIFDEQTMSVWVDDAHTDYAYNNISLMTFKENIIVGMEETVKSPTRNISVHYDRSASVVYVKSERELSSVIIYDVLGKTIVKDLGKGKDFRCPLGDAPSGVYLVKALGNEMDTTIKIVK